MTEKQQCPEGQAWDILLRRCYGRQIAPRRKPLPTTEQTLIVVDQVRTKTTAAKADALLVLSPTLWICVTLITLGSFLALTFWFLICRRQTGASANSEAAEPELEHLQKPQPPPIFNPPLSERNGQPAMFQRANEASFPCHQSHPGVQTGSTMGNGFSVCRGPIGHGSKDGGEALHACSTTADHKVPLPATELGGTALVTTKTV
ncbi:uncharacterized protein LOC133421412 [Cololabis saira]|uniref:uncharacterized protein LOC133421412 n=1 Tax=Cololabis saira TaxID=129043 RepID=UPI002AD1D208|nr:uncharacterized protein LOC133421412 [Cololabis saira]